MSEQTIERPRDDAGRFAGAEQTSTEHRAVEVSSSMAEAERPFDAFKPMERIVLEPAEKSDSYGSDHEGVKEASRELMRKRAEAEQNAPVVERAYHTAANTEQPRRPPTETVSLRDASRDLSELRQAENDAAEALGNMSLRERIDHFRQQADAEDRGQPVLEGDAVPEPQPEAPPSPAPTNGIDPEVAKALENPKIRAALEQEAMAHAGARQQYLSAVQQLGNVQTAALLSEFPELQSGNPRGTLELWRVSQPEKFAAVAGRLNQIQQVVNHWNGLQHQQQQQQAQQFGHFAKTADAEYDAFVKTRPPGEGKIVQQNLEGIFAHYGIDRGALTRLYNSSPEFRSVQFQRVMHDLALFHAARQASSQRGADPRVPKVFTPGDAASDRLTGQSAVVQQKMREFAQDPNPRTAAKALQARRRAASVLR